MKTIITILSLVILMSVSAQTTKTLTGVYKSTTETLGMEGACLYEIIFKDSKGDAFVLTDLFHGQTNDVLMTLFYDDKTDRMIQEGQFDRTMKSSVGKTFKITYEILQGDFQCWSLEAAELITKK